MKELQSASPKLMPGKRNKKKEEKEREKVLSLFNYDL